jgi:hypothetical protein
MAIPNTTPTPNELYNGEMRKMGDTELRVVLVVTRKTFGWQEDKKTGMRKKEDWINKAQLMKLTGRGSVSISKAIDGCIKKGWIEARDENGNILDTKDKRKRLGYAGKIYYRLGKIFLNNTTAIQKMNSKRKTAVQKLHSKNCIAESEQQKVNRNKRNLGEQKKPNTKETENKSNLTVTSSNKITTRKKYGNSDINKIISYLKEKLGLPKLDESEKTNRRYAWNLLRKFKGLENCLRIIDFASEDEWYRNNITSVKDLFYKGIKLISRKRGAFNDKKRAIDARKVR